MEVGSGSDDVLIETNASLGDGVIELSDGVEEFVCNGFVDERPQTFCRLELRTIGGQINQPDTFGNIEALGTVPARVVEREHDDARTSGAGFAGEGGEKLLEERLVDAVAEIPEGLSCDRRNEGRDVEPFVAMMAKRDRPFADRRPDATANRLQAEAMLVRRPDFDRLVRVGARLFGDGVFELFLKASRSSTVPAWGLRGRGT